jgi:formylglycine-generating enzyme
MKNTVEPDLFIYFHSRDALTPLIPSPGMLPGEGEHHPTPGMDPSPGSPNCDTQFGVLMHGRGDQGVREHKVQQHIPCVLKKFVNNPVEQTSKRKSTILYFIFASFFSFTTMVIDAQTSGRIEIEAAGGITLVSIPGGSFEMGSDAEYADWTEKPVHLVTLSPFFIGKTEITQEQYFAVTGSNPSHFSGYDNLPVECVSWYDAARFCNLLSEKAGLEKCYDETTWRCSVTANGFRLPTEAEFEYACRAGTKTKYWSGDDYGDLCRAGWFQANSGSKTHPVGTKPANPFGLHDTHGNVWEWCNDWYMENYYRISPQMNPKGIDYGFSKTARGGRFYSSARHSRATIRGALPPETKSEGYGFRIARNRSEK